MKRIEKLKEKINSLYQSKNPERARWADYLYKSHVFLVADKAGEIAKKVGANVEMSMAAGMLHDVADAVMDRFNTEHEEKSLEMARELLKESGFENKEIKIIVDDAIKHHSCKDGESPASIEGKAMATADAVVHLCSDFYEYGIEDMLKI